MVRISAGRVTWYCCTWSHQVFTCFCVHLDGGQWPLRSRYLPQKAPQRMSPLYAVITSYLHGCFIAKFGHLPSVYNLSLLFIYNNKITTPWPKARKNPWNSHFLVKEYRTERKAYFIRKVNTFNKGINKKPYMFVSFISFVYIFKNNFKKNSAYKTKLFVWIQYTS